MNTKVCSKCKEDKDIGEFNKVANNRDALRSWCRPCHNSYKKEWGIKNNEKIKQDGRKYYEDNKEKIADNVKRYYQGNKEKCYDRYRLWRLTKPRQTPNTEE